MDDVCEAESGKSPLKCIAQKLLDTSGIIITYGGQLKFQY